MPRRERDVQSLCRQGTLRVEEVSASAVALILPTVVRAVLVLVAILILILALILILVAVLILVLILVLVLVLVAVLILVVKTIVLHDWILSVSAWRGPRR